MGQITKLIIPAAGYGTRFLPWTKTLPKEMLPLLNRPLIDYIVQEAVLAGIQDIIFITSSNKKALEDYFDRNLELENALRKTKKINRLNYIQKLSSLANFIFIRQNEPQGNGHAILQAQPLIGQEPCAVVWGDEIWEANPPHLKQLIDAYQQQPGNIITLLEATSPSEQNDYAEKYGNVNANKISNGIYQINQIIEKPGKGAAISNLFSLGGFIFEPEYFNYLRKSKPGKGGEIWWNDALAPLIQQGRVYGKKIKGKYFDMGNPDAFIQTNLYFSQRQPNTKHKLKI